MSAAEIPPSGGRRAAAAVLSSALLLAGVVLAAAAGPVRLDLGVSQTLLLAILLPVYVFAQHYPLDFEFRRESNGITLVQLPLALGVQVVAPLAHLVTRVAAALLNAALERQAPQKALYNVAAAAFEVGAAAFAVGLVPEGETGPRMWLALYAGLIAGELLGSVVLHGIWRTLGVPVSAGRAVRTLMLTAPVSLLFTGLAVVAISAARVEPLTALLMLTLTGWLGLAYRGHRRVVLQQAATADLYSFVTDLGPLDVGDDRAWGVLEQVRVLLHAERLELATREGDRWSRLVVADGELPERSADMVSPLSSHVAATRAPALRSRQRHGDDTMATPLLSTTGLLGILTATSRLGNVRGFEPDDLRMLQTVGAELAIALERGRLHGDLERAAMRDPLTGLYNLREMTSRLSALLAAEPDRAVVLAAAAVDSFREVNDTLGHQVGDELLLEVTRRLRQAGPHALLGRIGGGRFAVALPAAEAGHDPEMFGLGLRAQVEGSVQVGSVGTHVRLSVGVARAPEHGDDAATLIRRAETAMYSARHAHGGPVLWEPAYEVQGQRRLAVVTALRDALATGSIGVAYQPKLESAGGRVSGVEALARWTHPALGTVRPDEFVPLAEASGLMGLLTTAVLRQSLAAGKAWQGDSNEVGVAVNVSADTVLDQGFVSEVGALLAEADVAPELLTLELTEGVLVSDPALAAVRMGELRGLGVKLSVDDFGTGYSSLAYLKGLPIDEVKIDRGFVNGLAGQPADRAVVRAVVDIAHTLGLKVVAEGVEQEDQQGILRALGVDEVQGYLHAKPMPAHEVTDWLRGRAAASRV
jgi:diguanylate cyclase (GGDEF)-like protein